MTAGVLTADTAAVVDAGPAGPEEPAEPYRWPVALLLHLGPGVLVMAGYLALLPLARALDLPAGLALTAAVALVGVPLQMGLLLRARRRRPVGFVAFRRRLPPGRLAALTGSGLVVGAGLYLWLQPLSGDLERYVFGWLPPAWFAGGEASVPRSALLAALLVSLVVDGLVSPVVQQLYFHGHLMPRLPVAAASPAGWLLAPVTSAALIAAQHLWQPHLVVFIFAVQVLLGGLVWRTRCLAVAILVQSAGNLLAITTTLLVVLAG